MEEMSKQEAEVNFSSPVEEAKYWREKVKMNNNLSFQLKLYYEITYTSPYIAIHGIFISQAIKLEKETKDVKEEFQEFQEGSRELEAELETQLEQVLSKTF